MATDDPMTALSALAGWQTIPHPRDTTVVRLALRTAKDRHDPERGGRRELLELVLTIEDQWLEGIL
jgi:hypothetical protein